MKTLCSVNWGFPFIVEKHKYLSTFHSRVEKEEFAITRNYFVKYLQGEINTQNIYFPPSEAFEGIYTDLLNV